MARHKRAPTLEHRTNRLKLPVRKKPYYVAVSPGISLGYRRNQVAGVWIVRAADGAGGSWIKRFAVADDHEEANGTTVLNFWQAQDQARHIARRDAGNGDRPVTVGEALDHYEAALRARGGDKNNVARVRHNLPSSLAAKTVALLGARELRSWRDGLVRKGLAPASADRTARALKAALTLAATDDQRITNNVAWRIGLARLPDAESSRNVILADRAVRDLVTAAYEAGSDFGLLIETLAVTGARFSQTARLEVRDLQDQGGAPRLLMPSSKKGRRRRIERRPVPITSSLYAALQQAVGDRPPASPLLVRVDGSPWGVVDRELFHRARTRVRLDSTVTPYALRHSSIVRQLLAGIPVRVVAVNHDTSIAMLEKTYSRYIADHSDTVTRRALLDMGEPARADNVLPLGRSA
jgi:integrase